MLVGAEKLTVLEYSDESSMYRLFIPPELTDIGADAMALGVSLGIDPQVTDSQK